MNSGCINLNHQQLHGCQNTGKHNVFILRRGDILIAHYCDVIMGAMASQITSLEIVYSTVYSCADQRKQQSSSSLAGICLTGEFPTQRPVTRKMFPFDDAIMQGCGEAFAVLSVRLFLVHARPIARATRHIKCCKYSKTNNVWLTHTHWPWCTHTHKHTQHLISAQARNRFYDKPRLSNNQSTQMPISTVNAFHLRVWPQPGWKKDGNCNNLHEK